MCCYMFPRILFATFAKGPRCSSHLLGLLADQPRDHIIADFMVTRDEEEVGIDDEKSALVVRDVATGCTYVYPRKTNTKRSSPCDEAFGWTY